MSPLVGRTGSTAHQPRLRIGLVGLGKMGILQGAIFHALEQAQLVAIAEPSAIVARSAQRMLPQIRFYRHPLRMIEHEQLDAVVVTAPTATHAAIIVSLLNERPVHVFVEKPLTGDAAESRTLLELAESRGVIHAVGYVRRFNPMMRAARRHLASGTIGSPHSFRATVFSGDIVSRGRGWRFARGGRGGVLTELGVHLLDLLLWFFGEPTEMRPVMKQLHSTEVEDFCHITLRYPDGMTGTVEMSWSVPEYRLPEISIEINGDRGTLVVDEDRQVLQLHGQDKPSEVLLRARHALSVPFLLGDHEYAMQAAHFLDCIARQERSTVDFRAGLAVDTLLTRIRQDAVILS